MSLETKIHKDINEYQEKILFGMSIRQLICALVSALLSVATGYIMTKKLGFTMDSASYVIILECMPIMALGFVRINGFTAEQYFKLLVKHYTGISRRKYRTVLEVDTIGQTGKEGKYVKRVEKKTGTAAGRKYSRGERKQERNRREADLFKITTKSRKRKCQEAKRKIKAARQEYRTSKRRFKKAAKKGGCPGLGPENTAL
ncbi:PrgI family protein [Enterocloster bolteae]|uniref:PrgI family protein n=1 Tax=Enterocloster bolteae TaxID=208479 RepID=UPI002A83C7D1|nr:PrgI family protein [Enterocloster bolteae]MBS5632611.1 PrgI family protein [Clostridiales bacterium]